ncbi:MAG: YajQ family cyclic di-GMP-binding protein [Candidatus Accumulibacter phosphatis]|uniref:Nucleotide-binding protein AW06_000361 n=2 Tax=Candidatus Accumulibacter TaxID=327159 RepID=A0A080MCQ5_9PROT|nr:MULTISPECIES: YajQ family cyclic di-GMP-binding protein [Candidatus Accumulibacter]KFB78255.1 MAG: putative nucleotide-binding protein [Candidatus Accumulibacter cognatus]MBL8401690.1 YajQ family cyclic di-GMP-binding protein [Accumulibacter sp.]MBN8516592.1 YajQ family cyclic di-GMP-binding protein [Accumulibacter sp.]MBO3710225.1 YajQ family cyclic di-GMP-binding protein [Accumulibacter sp.]MCC2867861.1 YajQ family cyclic di-GMP-binding protein [Candidatus Accumulibacter phosphatis]
MPSFDFSSEADMAALHNAIDVTMRAIDNRYDFKGTSAKVELNEKDKLITLYGDSEFQIGQIKDLLFPAMEKKEKESTKRLEDQPQQRISGNKVKQELKIRIGIESELAKKIVKLIKDSKIKVQASIQGDAVRVSGTKRDELQACIAMVTRAISDFPIKYGNFRD